MRRDEAQAILDAHAADLRARGVGRIALFGSVARDEAGPDSDIDLLVDYRRDRPPSPLDRLDLRAHLNDLFGRPVDLVNRAALDPLLKERIEAEAEGRFAVPTPPKSPRAALLEMLDNIDWLGGITRDRPFDDIGKDRMLRHTLERSIEIISEASRRIPEAMKAQHPHLPWRRIADVGNVIRHAYDGVDHAILWRIATDDLPALRAAVAAMLDRPGAP